MTFKDIFKKSFLEGFASAEITTPTVIVALGIACVLALYIFFVYRVVTRKTFYSKNFNITLAVITVITAALILTMQSSVVLSLGMVGALSIVRFRTAVKDPLDLAFLFWAISVGIICGATLFEVAFVVSILITVVMLALHFVPNVKPALLLIVSTTSSSCLGDLELVLKNHTRFYKIKSRNVTSGGMNLIVELKTNQENTLLDAVQAVTSVTTATLMEHDGEVIT